MRPGGTDDGKAGLLARALAGDEEAWSAIVHEYNGLLWWMARNHRLDDETAADVVQTVWFQLIRHGARIQNPAALPAWLATTARRESLRRVRPRDVPTEDIDDQPDRSTTGPAEQVVDEELVGMVLAAFAQLSPGDQRLLNLACAVPPKTYEEIAALLGKSIGYIGPSRQRALNRLRAHFEAMGGEL